MEMALAVPVGEEADRCAHHVAVGEGTRHVVARECHRPHQFALDRRVAASRRPDRPEHFHGLVELGHLGERPDLGGDVDGRASNHDYRLTGRPSARVVPGAKSLRQRWGGSTGWVSAQPRYPPTMSTTSGSANTIG